MSFIGAMDHPDIAGDYGAYRDKLMESRREADYEGYPDCICDARHIDECECVEHSLDYYQGGDDG